MGTFSAPWVVQVGVPNPIERTGPRSLPCRASVQVRVPYPVERLFRSAFSSLWSFCSGPGSRLYRACVQIRVPDSVEC